MATERLSERVSRLEGGYEHVATKERRCRGTKLVWRSFAKSGELADFAEVRAEAAEISKRPSRSLRLSLQSVKVEITEVRTRRFAGLRASFAQIRGEVNSRFAQMDAKFAQMENLITLKLGGLFIAISGALFAALRLLD